MGKGLVGNGGCPVKFKAGGGLLDGIVYSKLKISSLVFSKTSSMTASARFLSEFVIGKLLSPAPGVFARFRDETGKRLTPSVSPTPNPFLYFMHRLIVFPP